MRIKVASLPPYFHVEWRSVKHLETTYVNVLGAQRAAPLQNDIFIHLLVPRNGMALSYANKGCQLAALFSCQVARR